MESKELVCIGCPLGCTVRVELDEKGEIRDISGYTCKRGEEYARREVTAPERMVTTTVRAQNGSGVRTVSVKSAGNIPKEKIFDFVRELKDIELCLPVKIGDVVKKNVADTGIDAVVTCNRS